jgi:hypothetical protein
MNIVQEFANIGIDIQLREKEVIAIFAEFNTEAEKVLAAALAALDKVKSESSPDEA